MTRRKRRPDRRGAAAVEMAIVLPLFFLVVLGIIEFGRALMVSQLLTTAARDAGRVAIMGGSSTAEVEQVVKDFVVATVGVAEADVAVVVTEEGGGDVSDADSGDLCTIQVNVAFDKVSYLPGSYLSGKTLQGKCMMRHL